MQVLGDLIYKIVTECIGLVYLSIIYISLADGPKMKEAPVT